MGDEIIVVKPLRIQIECFWERPESFYDKDARMRRYVEHGFPGVKLRCFTFYVINYWAYRVIYDYEAPPETITNAMQVLHSITKRFYKHTVRCTVCY